MEDVPSSKPRDKREASEADISEKDIGSAPSLPAFIEKTEKEMNVLRKKVHKELREKNKQDIVTMKKENPDINRILYPSLDDPNFNSEIYAKKEFRDVAYEPFSTDVEKMVDEICNAPFELSPHQIFVRNFLSFLTPYNSLLLYHGLGTGKTCSAIGVCEEMRTYYKQMGIKKKIIIVASPNVLNNFKTQLFDERKLKEINGIWNLRACTGNIFLHEINPMNIKGLSREKLILQVKKIIRENYHFMGYIEFSNYITRIKEAYSQEGEKEAERIRRRKYAIEKEFSHRLIVIDEVHNLRITGDSPNKKLGQNLLDIVTHSDTLKLLLLSATPMYNSHREIIWLLNLMNANDNRPQLQMKDVFDSKGNFKMHRGENVGKQHLISAMNGYISYVRGENPYSFPYRIFPHEYKSPHSILDDSFTYPRTQINGAPIIQGMEYVDVFTTGIGDYQKTGYEIAIQQMKERLPAKEGMESGMGWQYVETPLQTLNIVYPSAALDRYIQDPSSEDPKKIQVSDYVGSAGLSSVMEYDESRKRDYRYGSRIKDTHGAIFAEENLAKYSTKLHTMIQQVKKSKGIVLVYSQYIDGGCVPIALALEQIGITRYGNRSLFEKEPVPKLDARTMKPSSEKKGDFKPARYIMITGDKNLSPNNQKEVKAATNETNKYGEDVKVIIISRAGAEGIDFNNIRQVHIMEPWYNMSRIDQIIGRGVRFRSHCKMPFAERNVQIFLYGTKPYDEEDTEPIDLYIYRHAEMKAVQIGRIARIMEEHAVDCYLTSAIRELTEDKIDKEITITLSSGDKVPYRIGYKPFTQICDYLEKCTYRCEPGMDKEAHEKEPYIDTYHEDFLLLNNEKIIQKIKEIFKSRFVLSKKQLILELNKTRRYPLLQIDSALDTLVGDPTEILVDMFGKSGTLVNIDDLYMFQPIEVDEALTRYERAKPIDVTIPAINVEVTGDIVEEDLVHAADVPKVISVDGDKSKNERMIRVGKHELLRTMEENYKLATETDEVPRGTKSWYIHCSETIRRLNSSYSIELSLLHKFVIHHAFDVLSTKDKMALVEEFLRRSPDGDFEKEMVTHMNRVLRVSHKDRNGYVFIDQDKPVLYLVSDKNTLVKAKPLDTKDFTPSIARLRHSPDTLNRTVGFMMKIKGSDNIVFKTKDIEKKRNSGATCYQSGKKAIVLTLNEIVGGTPYTTENVKLLKTDQLCSEQEFILRYYQHEKKNGVVWFLPYEESILTEISTLQRK